MFGKKVLDVSRKSSLIIKKQVHCWPTLVSLLWLVVSSWELPIMYVYQQQQWGGRVSYMYIKFQNLYLFALWYTLVALVSRLPSFKKAIGIIIARIVAWRGIISCVRHIFLIWAQKQPVSANICTERMKCFRKASTATTFFRRSIYIYFWIEIYREIFNGQPLQINNFVNSFVIFPLKHGFIWHHAYTVWKNDLQSRALIISTLKMW